MVTNSENSKNNCTVAKQNFWILYFTKHNILEYIIDNFNEEVDEVKKSLETFILNLNNRNIISVSVVPLILAQIYQHEKPDVVLSGAIPNLLSQKMTEYIENVDKNVKVVKEKDVFDTIILKKTEK